MLNTLLLIAALHAAPAELDPPADTAPRAADHTAAFVGAFIGGVVGAAVPLVFVAAMPCALTFGCPATLTAEAIFTGYAWSVYAQLGAATGAAIAGGGFALGAAMLGAGLGTVLAQLLLLLGEEAYGAGVLTAERSLPFLLPAAALAGGGAAAAVVLRRLQLQHTASPQVTFKATARIVVTTIVTVTASAVVGLLLGLVTLALQTNQESLALLGPPVLGGVGAFGVGAIAFAGWGFHRLMGGEGTWWAPYVPLVVAAALTLLSVFPLNFGRPEPLVTVRQAGLTGVAVPLALLGPAFALEASAGLVPPVSVGFLPLSGGALGSVTLRL